jgi:hypothetical protein
MHTSVLVKSLFSGRSGGGEALHRAFRNLDYTLEPYKTMKSTIAMMAAFGLIMSALSAPAADKQITYVPFTITSPGKYVLASNLNCPSDPAINLNPSVSGPIIIDLNGHTLSGLGGAGVFIQGYGNPILDQSSVIVRNGTIEGFQVGVSVGWTTNVQIRNITFHNNTIYGVDFNHVNLSSVSNCNFINDVTGYIYQSTGIQDYDTQGGNQCTNNHFDGHQMWTLVVWNNAPSTLEHYEFSEPPAQ